MKAFRTLMIFATACILWGNPEAPGTAALSTGVVLTVGAEEEVEGVGSLRRVPEIKPDSLVFETSDEGTRFLVLRIDTGDSAAARLYIRNMALPENAKLFVYGVTAGSVTRVVGPYEGAGPLESGDFWTEAVAGSEIVVELQADEVLADLPFEIVGLLGSDVSEVPVSTPDSIEDEDIRTSVFRGVALTHSVKNGKAIFEGDIELGNADELLPADSRSKNGSREAAAITGANYRWPSGVIPYSIDPAMPTPARVTDSIAHWNSKLAGHVQWVPRTNEKAFVNFVRSTSASTCSSAVGRMGFEQGISIGDSCVKGNIIHEMGHAVGLWHEQAREDRDQYVQILWENIKSDVTYNFTQNISNGDDLGVYDYGSIMHYPTSSFSKNGLPTIQTIPQGIAIGQRTALSASDILAVKTMYPATTTPAPAATVTFESNPSALTITVDGVSYKTPKTFTWVPGSVHTINAVNPPVASGTRNQFVRWTDGGTQSHTIVAPTVSKVYRADYATSYSAVITAAAPGSVVVSPASTDTFYPKGQSVQLDAIAPADHCFSSWTGLAAGTQASTKVTISKAYTVNANYLPGGISVLPASLVAPVKASTQQITVSATTGCPWTATSPVTWIKITAGTSGNGSATVTLSVAARAATTPSRTATLTIAGQQVVITQ